MLSDRHYMRDNDERPQPSMLTWVIVTLIVGFVVQNIFERWFGTSAFESAFALSVQGIRQEGYLWSVLTYPLLHDGVLHLLANVLGIFFLGRALQPILSDRGFAQLTLGAAVLGGLVWFAAHFAHGGGFVVGASGIAMAYLALFACIYPNREMTFLIFFILPVTVKPKWVAAVLGAIDLLGFLFSELPGGRFEDNVAHSVHLAGMLAGWLYFRLVHQSVGRDSFPPPVALPRWLRRKTPDAPAPMSVPDATRPADLRAEVDRILDKINSDGFGALTPAEKRVLDEAKEFLSRR